MTSPAKYGSGLGPYKAIQGQELTIRLVAGGVNVSKSPVEIEEGESPNATDVRFGDGGVSSDYGLSLLGASYAGAGDKTIIGMAEFTKKNLPANNRLVRMRPAGWDRWDGASWLTLSGSALSGVATDRLYHVSMQDLLVVANKVNRLQSWDGQDATPVADLSPDAPIAWFVTPIGNRLMAARLKVGSDIDPYALAWSADDLITNWTSAGLGAGTAFLEPEGRGGGPDFISGLAAIETAAVVFRQRSIVMGVRTGIGSQPFRFSTVIFGLGTDAPYAVASTGHAVGVIFLGNDLNVHLFDGQNAPVTIGDPIRLALRSQIQDPALCFGTMDLRNLEYWLLVKRTAALPDFAWIFSVREYIVNHRLSWRKRDLAGYASAAFSKTALQATPVVNAVSNVVNTVSVKVNDYGLAISPERIVLGDGAGGVSFVDESKFLVTGTFESRMLGDPQRGLQLDRTYLTCSSPTGATIEVSLSTDGGVSWTMPKVINLPVTNNPQAFGTWFAVVVSRWQYRLRILSGNVTISEIKTNVTSRGPISA